MKCFNHPETEAVGACVYCGKLFCAECLVEVKGKNYCKADVAKVIEEVKEGASRQPETQKIVVTNQAPEENRNGLRTAVLALSIIFGIGGIFWSFLAGCAFGVANAFTQVSAPEGAAGSSVLGLARGTIAGMLAGSFFVIVAAMVIALVGASQKRKRTPTIVLASITMFLGLASTFLIQFVSGPVFILCGILLLIAGLRQKEATDRA
jgi:hypothetical protein